VIHTVGPIYSGAESDETDLYNCYYNSLSLAKENDVHSIAFPGISTGVYGYPKEAAAKTALGAITTWLSDNSEYDMKITIVNFSEHDYEVYQSVIGR
jgi:O-acetyl-ADP-ribose deacetylase (regulator of RNase III)